MSVNFDCESVADGIFYFLSSFDCLTVRLVLYVHTVWKIHITRSSSRFFRQSFHPRAHTYPSPHWHLAIKFAASFKKFRWSFCLFSYLLLLREHEALAFSFWLPASSQLCGAIDFNIIDFFVPLPTTRFAPYI